jgi:hypothetical protein
MATKKQKTRPKSGFFLLFFYFCKTSKKSEKTFFFTSLFIGFSLTPNPHPQAQNRPSPWLNSWLKICMKGFVVSVAAASDGMMVVKTERV